MRLTKLKIDAESSMGAGGGEGVQGVALSIVVSIVVVCYVIRLTSWRRTKDAWRAALHVCCDSAAKWPILWYLLQVIPFAGQEESRGRCRRQQLQHCCGFTDSRFSCGRGTGRARTWHEPETHG